MPPNANASMPPCTPADFASDMAASGSGHADTINPYSTRSACFADLRDHAVRLMNRRGGIIACADVATVKAKAATAINFSNFVSPLFAAVKMREDSKGNGGPTRTAVGS